MKLNMKIKYVKNILVTNIFTLANVFPSMTFVEQLSSFADEEVCPHGMRRLATSLINKSHDWSTLCSIDVTSWRRLFKITRTVANFIL